MVDLAGGDASGGGGSVIGFGLYAARPLAGAAPGQLYIATNSPVPLWVWDGAAWRPYLQTAIGTAPPAASGFAGVNEGAATLADENGTLAFTGVDDGSAASGTLRAFALPRPAGATPRIELGALTRTTDLVVTGSYSTIAIGMRYSASARAWGMLCFIGMSSQTIGWETDQWTSNTARTGTLRGTAVQDGQGPFFARVQIVGADIVASASRDLNDWQVIGSTPLATAFPAAPSNLPDQCFIGALGIATTPRWNATHLVVA